MPPAPKIFDRRCNVRVVKVFWEMEAENTTQTNGHVRITGKIEIDLQSIGYYAKPSCACGQLIWILAKNPICDLTKGIGQKDLFRETK